MASTPRLLRLGYNLTQLGRCEGRQWGGCLGEDEGKSEGAAYPMRVPTMRGAGVAPSVALDITWASDTTVAHLIGRTCQNDGVTCLMEACPCSLPAKGMRVAVATARQTVGQPTVHSVIAGGCQSPCD